MLCATPSARTRFLNARAETALLGVRDHRARREMPGGHQRQWVRGTGPCRAAEQLRAKHPDVSHNPSGSPAGYFPACKIPDSEAAKQPPAARALQPRLGRPPPPRPAPRAARGCAPRRSLSCRRCAVPGNIAATQHHPPKQREAGTRAWAKFSFIQDTDWIFWHFPLTSPTQTMPRSESIHELCF